MTTSKKMRLEEMTTPYVTEDNLTDVVLEHWKAFLTRGYGRSCNH